LSDGDAVYADRVVVATGLGRQQFRPPAFADVPAAFASHTGDYDDLGAFHGRRVAVVGRGQSACESAVLLREAGADVELICRGDIHWLGGGRPERAAVGWLSERLASPSGVGPFPLNWFAEMPDAASLMPAALRMRFNARCLRPGAAGWLRSRFDGVRVLAGERIHAAVVTGERIALMLDHGSAVFDHSVPVIGSTLRSLESSAPTCCARLRAATARPRSPPDSNRPCRACISSAPAPLRATAR
jgi:cation diffusion facilitator CzcD-associated flavoprotein CzcO